MESVLFEQRDHIGWLTLNRPEQQNALSLEVMGDMLNTLQRVAIDRDIHVLIIRGNGPVFCAGHDLKELTGKQYDIHHFRRVFSVCSTMMQTLQHLPQPVIAQVHGVATAAGCQLVAACDLAIAERHARFATPGVKIGLFCSTPMVPLSRVIGRRRALDMLLSGRYVSAEEAERFGLVNRVVDIERLGEEAEQWARELAQYSLYTLELGKKAFYHQINQDEASAYDYVKEIIAQNCLAEDAQEGMQAFLEKRAPQWKDR